MTPSTAKPDNLRRAIRGGSWYVVDASGVRSSACNDYAPARRLDLVGFRTTLAGRTTR